MDEKASLLSADNTSTNNYSTINGSVTVRTLENEDIPKLTTRDFYGLPSIPCKICSNGIDIQGKQNQHVVKCPQCHEATPLKPPPIGKKYVRCVCNCLLVCKSTAQKISCPRANCKRVLKLTSPNSDLNRLRSPGTVSVQCAYCRHPFLFNIVNNAVAICPHCRKRSSVGPLYAIRRAIFWGLITVLFIGGLAVSLIYTLKSLPNEMGYIALYAALVLAVLVGLYRTLHFAMMKVSKIQSLDAV